MNPIKFNNNDKLPSEALIPYKKKQQAMNSIENKQRELIAELKKLIELCEAPQYHEVMTAKAIQKTVVISHEAELAALEQQPKESTLTAELYVKKNLIIKPTFTTGVSTAVETYHVVDESGAIWFVGTFIDCQEYLKTQR